MTEAGCLMWKMSAESVSFGNLCNLTIVLHWILCYIQNDRVSVVSFGITAITRYNGAVF